MSIGGKSTKILSGPTLMNNLESRYNQMISKLKHVISKQNSVCATVNCWSARRRGYIGATCHWINNETLVRESCALACSRIQGSHTYDVLARKIQKILEKFSIEILSKTMVTDNGSNFVKAFR